MKKSNISSYFIEQIGLRKVYIFVGKLFKVLKFKIAQLIQKTHQFAKVSGFFIQSFQAKKNNDIFRVVS